MVPESHELPRQQSFGLFVQNIKNDAVATLSESEKASLRDLLEAKTGIDRADDRRQASPRREGV